MFTIEIDVEKCEACEECVSTCPTELFEMGEVNGKKVAIYKGGPDDCIGCASCESVCESGSITLKDE